MEENTLQLMCLPEKHCCAIQFMLWQSGLLNFFLTNCLCSVRSFLEDGSAPPRPSICCVILTLPVAPLAPNLYLDFTSVLRRHGSKHTKKIDWKKNPQQIIKVLFDTCMVKEKQAWIHLFPLCWHNQGFLKANLNIIETRSDSVPMKKGADRVARSLPTSLHAICISGRSGDNTSRVEKTRAQNEPRWSKMS